MIFNAFALLKIFGILNRRKLFLHCIFIISDKDLNKTRFKLR